PVLVACADEAAPVDLVPDDQRFDLLAAAVVLAPGALDAGEVLGASDTRGARAATDVREPVAAAAGACRAQLRLLLGREPDVAVADLPPALARNPQAGLLDLVAAVLRGASGLVRLDRGGGAGWCAEIRTR
ncbi:MAG TPA: hypothetical protein VK824_03240, partial [Planctomycetota bacterium]|nr:hypothetical protein [Planctomycetota bacterium]